MKLRKDCRLFSHFQVFKGNSDRHTVVSHVLSPPITARFIRFHPKTWHGHISMRVEILGCYKGMKHCRNFMCIVRPWASKCCAYAKPVILAFRVAVNRSDASTVVKRLKSFFVDLKIIDIIFKVWVQTSTPCFWLVEEMKTLFCR